jgi:hypothetical protein
LEPDLSVLGNAAAVPIVVAITQFLKKSFDFKRKADVISLLVSLVVCFGWEFYHTAEADLFLLWGTTIISNLKHAISLLVISFATWLSASKSYDLFLGDKKRNDVLNQHIQEKEELQKQVEELKAGNEQTVAAPTEEPSDVDDRLRTILEGKE